MIQNNIPKCCGGCSRLYMHTVETNTGDGYNVAYGCTIRNLSDMKQEEESCMYRKDIANGLRL